MTTKTNQKPPPQKVTPISAAIKNRQEPAIPLPKPPRTKKTYIAAPLPIEGYVRKPSFLAALGISSTSFENGIKAGTIPAGILLTPRCRVWDVVVIRAYLASLKATNTNGVKADGL